MDPLNSAGALVHDTDLDAAADDSSNLQHAPAVHTESCSDCDSHENIDPPSSSSSSIPLLDTELPDLSSDSVSSKVGSSDEDGNESVPAYQMLLIWSMQHMRLVEVNLGVQREEFAWYSFAGRPWAPSKPLLAALSSDAESMESGGESTAVIVVDIDGAQHAAMCIPGAWGLAWSPDSCHLAASANNTISVLSIASGAARSIARPGYGIAWSPDSTHLMCCGVLTPRQYFLDVRADQLQEVASSSAQLGMVSSLAWHSAFLVATTPAETLCFTIDDHFQLELDRRINSVYDGCPAFLTAGGCVSIAGVVQNAVQNKQVLLTQLLNYTSCRVFPAIPADAELEFEWNADRYSLACTQQGSSGYLRHEIFLLEQPDLAGISSRCVAWKAFRPEDTPATPFKPLA